MDTFDQTTRYMARFCNFAIKNKTSCLLYDVKILPLLAPGTVWGFGFSSVLILFVCRTKIAYK